MRSLRIAQVCADKGIAPGSTKGAAQHLRGIADGLQSAGNQVVSYCARAAEGPFPATVRPLSDLQEVPADHIDVVYERYSLGHRDGLALARERDVRFVLEVNAPLVDEARAHRPETLSDNHESIERELVREADLVVVVSSGLATWAARFRRDKPIAIIPNGFEPAWFPHPALSRAPTLAFLGHPKPWHGAGRLPTILATLRDMGHRPRLEIIGGGPGAAEIVRVAKQLHIEDQITVTGALPPALASHRLAEATIGLAPYSTQHPFYFCPLKVIDYLAAGLPVVSTDQGDIATIVGEAGILVDADDTQAITSAIARLLDSPVTAREIGLTGRRAAFATMTWDHVALRTLEAIGDLKAQARAI